MYVFMYVVDCVQVLLDEVRAGGRIPLIIGKNLTNKARQSLQLSPTTVFRSTVKEEDAAAVKVHTYIQIYCTFVFL